jgi:hypothetical protein
LTIQAGFSVTDRLNCASFAVNDGWTWGKECLFFLYFHCTDFSFFIKELHALSRTVKKFVFGSVSFPSRSCDGPAPFGVKRSVPALRGGRIKRPYAVAE